MKVDFTSISKSLSSAKVYAFILFYFILFYFLILLRRTVSFFFFFFNFAAQTGE